MFVAEAPGRLGADRTRVPLQGDQTGRNFEILLEAAGLARSEIFITNSVLCNPRDKQGRNARPTRDEIRQCRGHLARTLHIVNPCVVVALGSVALAALGLIVPHALKLRTDVGTVVEWNGRLLVPLYHPGARARIHRPIELQLRDFRNLSTLFSGVIRA